MTDERKALVRETVDKYIDTIEELRRIPKESGVSLSTIADMVFSHEHILEIIEALEIPEEEVTVSRAIEQFWEEHKFADYLVKRYEFVYRRHKFSGSVKLALAEEL